MIEKFIAKCHTLVFFSLLRNSVISFFAFVAKVNQVTKGPRGYVGMGGRFSWVKVKQFHFSFTLLEYFILVIVVVVLMKPFFCLFIDLRLRLPTILTSQLIKTYIYVHIYI